MSALEILEQAIRTRKPIKFRYTADGKVDGERIGHPHVLYLSLSEALLCDTWQTSGASSDQETVPGWRCFKVADIQIIAILEEEDEFVLSPSFNPVAERFEQTIALGDIVKSCV